MNDAGIPAPSALRPDQLRCVAELREAFRAGARRVCFQSPTGFGKTHTAAELIRGALARGKRVAFVAHLDAIMSDTERRLLQAGIPVGIVQADVPTNADAPVQLCSLATLDRRGVVPRADFVIFDEAHRALADGARETLARWPDAHVLGLTATPQRGDGRPLGDIFVALVCGPSIRELVALGLLCRTRVVRPEVSDDDDGALAADPLDAYLAHAAGRPAIVFAVHSAHARDLAERFTAAGHPARTILAETPTAERVAARDAVIAGTLRVLVTVAALAEGFDCPPVSCVILCRSCSTVASYLQPIGRAMRPWPGKLDALVIDLRGAVFIHGMPDALRRWSLTGAACTTPSVGPDALRRCRSCHAIFPPAAVCPQCGARVEADLRRVRVSYWRSLVESAPTPAEVASVADRYTERLRARFERLMLDKGHSPERAQWIARKMAREKLPRYMREALEFQHGSHDARA